MATTDIVILARDSAGTETDITEAVRILYDTVHASMDWGSGFLDGDEVGHIAALADACGFDGIEEVIAAYPVMTPYVHGLSGDDRRAAARREITDKAKTARAMFRSIPKVDPR